MRKFPSPRYQILLIAVLTAGLFTASSGYGQSWPSPAITIDEVDLKTGDRLDIYSFLEKDLLRDNKNRCLNTWDVFYFRVNQRGKIDSLFHQGTLPANVSGSVIRNIYSTQGHWRVPKGVKLKQGYWFVYPYFDFGQEWYEHSTCSEANRLLQQNLIDLSEHFMHLAAMGKGQKPFFLRPYRIGGGFDQE